MKIPETSANVGAYYGNEENGQWQPNGVIIDSGVGGGVVGSGDAGLHRPVYPIHIPRGHVSGYVMAGAYYGPAGGGVGAGAAGYVQGPPPDDFADYMWMEHEEEFDKQVMQQLEEEALMEQCIEAMLEDEQRERQRPAGSHEHPTTSNGTTLSLEETVSRSTLNPLAAEFVPTRKPSTEDKIERPAETEAETEAPAEVINTDTTLHSKTEVTAAPLTEEPPEVSAADVQPCDRRGKKPDKKNTPQSHNKKTKPLPAKSDTKLVQQSKKKEPAKAVKSESRVSDVTAAPSAPPAPASEPALPSAPEAEPTPTPTPAPATTPAPTPAVAPAPVEVIKPTQPSVEDIPAGPKPINYAAAAKANKPKKPTTPLTLEKTPPPVEKTKPVEKSQIKTKTEKMAAKEKPAQRKNSAK